jgi:S-adenosylmethionine decarboxylase
MSVGIEWIVDAEGCDPLPLRDPVRVRGLLERVIRELALNVVGAPLVHAFDGEGGVTALYLLSESHLACHTYPERHIATVNLYCCRPRPPFPWSDALRESFAATEVTVRTAVRGAEDEARP